MFCKKFMQRNELYRPSKKLPLNNYQIQWLISATCQPV